MGGTPECGGGGRRRPTLLEVVSGGGEFFFLLVVNPKVVGEAGGEDFVAPFLTLWAFWGGARFLPLYGDSP